jgi:predicted NBD/HSP70 family sugar kinase
MKDAAVGIPAIPSLMREINARSTLDLLREHGALHAAEIARLIGLSRPTTAEILRGLADLGLVQELTPGADDSKRARSVYEAISDVKIALAIDIGSKYIRAAAGDLNLKMLSHSSIPLKSLALKDLVAAMHAAVNETLKTSGYTIKDVATIVVGTPGVINQATGTISIAGTIASLDGVDLASLIEREFGIHPKLENDINLVTVAEQFSGHGREIEDFAVLSVGSGLGSGIVVNGKLLRGHRGAAGEVFFIPFGDPLDTHRSQSNPSADSIAELARSLAKKIKKSSLREPFSTIDILAAAKAGDELAKAVVAIEAERIALYIAAISAVTDVELVVLSGGIGRQAAFFLDQIQGLVSKVLPFPPRIEVSTLGDTGILIGALNIATKAACDLIFSTKISSRALAGSM